MSLAEILAPIRFEQWIDSGLLPNITWPALPRAVSKLNDPDLGWHSQNGVDMKNVMPVTIPILSETITVDLHGPRLSYVCHVKKITTDMFWVAWIISALTKKDIQLVNGAQKFVYSINTSEYNPSLIDYIFYQIRWSKNNQLPGNPLTFISPLFGYHVSIDDIPDKGICQIFLSSPQNRSFSCRAPPAKSDQHIYVHGTYLINTCRIDHWAYERSKLELTTAVKLNYRGWVVHIGSKLTETAQTGTNNLYRYIEEVIQYATPQCPLILETSAGEGGDILTTPDDLLNLMLKYNDPRLKLCIDTCHVFSAGYDPLYIIKYIPIEYIALIHFNDSQGPRGCHKDRHAIPGTGYVAKDMIEIFNHVVSIGVPMIRE